MNFDAALAILAINLQTMENNEPINRAAGQIDQAELERKTAESIRAAMSCLNHA